MPALILHIGVYFLLCQCEAAGTLCRSLKQDWPSKWLTLITDTVSASETSELLRENSIVILWHSQLV